MKNIILCTSLLLASTYTHPLTWNDFHTNKGLQIIFLAGLGTYCIKQKSTISQITGFILLAMDVALLASECKNLQEGTKRLFNFLSSLDK